MSPMDGPPASGSTRPAATGPCEVPARREMLAAWLAEQTGARRCEVLDLALLGGGAIQQNWRLDIAFSGGARPGPLHAVLRTDAPSAVAVSHDRAAEFALARAAFTAGVTVPEPLFLCADPDVLGKPFSVMRRVAGEAAGGRIVRGEVYRGDPAALAHRLGAELARLHAIVPPRSELGFLGPPRDDYAAGLVADYRSHLDALPGAWPILEWGLRWLERNAPLTPDPVLAHRDFRTGNYMVDAEGLTGVLDWEFAGWGDRHEDLGWFCAKSWRFGRHDREAGGLADREALYAGYESVAGPVIDRASVPYWEVMAYVRWAVIALQQGERHCSGLEPSLELALTGHRPAEIQFDMLASLQRLERTETAAPTGRSGPAQTPSGCPETGTSDGAGSWIDRPHGAALLAIARQTLEAELLPALSGDRRATARMIARAVAMVERELSAPAPAAATDLSELAATIRRGDFDAAGEGREAMRRRLNGLSAAQLDVVNPCYLETERLDLPEDAEGGEDLGG